MAHGVAAPVGTVAAQVLSEERDDPWWAGWADKAERSGLVPIKGRAGHKEEWAEIRNRLQKPFSDLNQGFEFKNQGFKYF
jgi:hypothetical protein